MPTTYPSEANLSDAAIFALEGTTDQATGIPVVAAGTNSGSAVPLRVQFGRMVAQLLRTIPISVEGRVVKETTALKIGVFPINYIQGGSAKTYDGSTNNSVTNAATNYVYLNSSNTLVINTTGYPTDMTNHFRLARVVCSGGAVSSITDDRGFMRHAVPTATSTTDTGTNEQTFIIDADNASSGADTGVRFNRGSTAGDAGLDWDETNDLFKLLADVDAPTLATLNLLAIAISGTTMLDANGAAKVASGVAGNGLQHSGGVLSVKTASSLGTSVSASGVGVDPSEGITIDANGVAVSLTANGGLQLSGSTGSKTLGVYPDGLTIQADSSGVAVKDAGLTPVKAAVQANASGGGLVSVVRATLVGGNTVTIFNADAPFKFEVIDVWSVAKSADGGSWYVDNGTNAITDTVAVTGTDKTVDRAGTIDDAYSTILSSGTLRVVGDGSLADAVVFVMIQRVA